MTTNSKWGGWVAVFSLAAAMQCLMPCVRADVINLNATGPEEGFELGSPAGPGTYDATLSYDTTETATSTTGTSASYDATLTFNPGTPEPGTLTIIQNTVDPSSNPADKVEFTASGFVPPFFSFTDVLDIYAPVGTFSLNLPTLSDWQNLIASNTYQADANGSEYIFSYDAGPLTLSVSSAASTVPTPAAAVGALPLLAGVYAFRAKRGVRI